MRTTSFLFSLAAIVTILACDSRRPEFSGTWLVREPVADTSVTFEVSMEVGGGYSVSGHTRVVGGLYEVRFRIEDVRTADGALRFRITSGIPIEYEVRPVSGDTLVGAMTFPNDPSGKPTDVLWVRAN